MVEHGVDQIVRHEQMKHVTIIYRIVNQSNCRPRHYGWTKGSSASSIWGDLGHRTQLDTVRLTYWTVAESKIN